MCRSLRSWLGDTVLSPFLGILGDVNRTERLYAIAEELRAAGRAGRTSTWLARRLEVSARTVKRDVDALLQAGVPIWAQAGRGGGYVLEAGLPPLNVTAAEAAAIAVALAALPGPALRGGCPLRAVQGPRRDDRTRNASGPRPSPDACGCAHPSGRPDRRSPACWTRPCGERRVRGAATTRTPTGAATRRAVEPVALAATGGHWYLLAWCRLRRGPRWFRTDRITAAHLDRRGRTRTRRGDAVRHSARRRAPRPPALTRESAEPLAGTPRVTGREDRMSRFTGKVAVITGAARGQGRSHAVRLASEGADVIALDICHDIDSVAYDLATPADLKETARLVAEQGGGSSPHEVDVRDADAVASAITDGARELGGIDVVLANAGIGIMDASADPRRGLPRPARRQPGRRLEHRPGRGAADDRAEARRSGRAHQLGLRADRARRRRHAAAATATSRASTASSGSCAPSPPGSPRTGSG